MSDTFLTMIVPDADVALAREIAATVSTGGAGMWITPLSPTGQEPVTAWVSTGYVPEAWQTMIPVSTYTQDADGAWALESRTDGQPEDLAVLCESLGLDVPLADITALFAAVDVTQQDPWTAFARLGVQMVEPPEPEPEPELAPVVEP